MKRSKPHRLQDHVIKFPAITFELVRFMKLAFAANGLLKVSPFLAASEVIIDGVFTNSGDQT